MLARVGGEEFAVILPACDLSQARIVAEKLRLAVSSVNGVGSDDAAARIPLTVSVGGAAQAGSALDAQQLIERADAALLQAKRTGRNKTVVWGDPLRLLLAQPLRLSKYQAAAMHLFDVFLPDSVMCVGNAPIARTICNAAVLCWSCAPRPVESPEQEIRRATEFPSRGRKTAALHGPIESGFHGRVRESSSPRYDDSARLESCRQAAERGRALVRILRASTSARSSRVGSIAPALVSGSMAEPETMSLRSTETGWAAIFIAQPAQVSETICQVLGRLILRQAGTP